MAPPKVFGHDRDAKLKEIAGEAQLVGRVVAPLPRSGFVLLD
jgi:hypothetical protein